jgi:predicted MFS family arabinose efflux permease
MEVVPGSYHGLMNALLMFAWTSSWMISTRIGGAVIELYGYTISLLIAVTLYVISALLYYFSFRNDEQFTSDGIVIQTKYKVTA